jgi:hypothetical protein
LTTPRAIPVPVDERRKQIKHIGACNYQVKKMATLENGPVQVSFPLPSGMNTKIHMRMTIQSKAILLFLTTVAAEDLDKPASMGAFVYALPDVSFLHPILQSAIAPPTLSKRD